CEVRLGERHIAGIAGGAAGRKDAHDMVARRGKMIAKRRMIRLALTDFVLFGERKRGDIVEFAGRGRAGKARSVELTAIERRGVEKIVELLAVTGAVERALLARRPAFDLRTIDVRLFTHVHAAPSFSSCC